jgi:putative phosphoesterase
VKIAIISDIHANFAALEAFPERDYDQLWCLGDLIDYGPKPVEVIRKLKKTATITVRGNHDHAVGFNVDPQCSLPFKKMAAETREFTQRICGPDELEYLRSLPVQREVNIEGTRFYLVHAMPTNPLFGYCSADSDQWEKELEWVRAEVLVVGHTHTPFIRRIGNRTVVNPGSLGQPKTGRSLACYAIWEDGELSLKEYPYPVNATIDATRAMPISREVQEDLIATLATGAAPRQHATRS